MQVKERLRLVHKEILLLVFISLGTVPLFVFTREMTALRSFSSAPAKPFVLRQN